MLEEVHEYLKTAPSLKRMMRGSELQVDVRERVGLRVYGNIRNLQINFWNRESKLKETIQKALDKKYPDTFFVSVDKTNRSMCIGFEEGWSETQARLHEEQAKTIRERIQMMKKAHPLNKKN